MSFNAVRENKILPKISDFRDDSFFEYPQNSRDMYSFRNKKDTFQIHTLNGGGGGGGAGLA